MGIQLFFGIGVGAAIVFGAYAIYQFVERRALKHLFAQSLFLIKVPRSAHAEKSDFKSEINRSEQLLSNLAALHAPFTLEVVVPHVGEEIHFFLGVPKVVSEVAIKQVQGLWNGASVEAVGDDFNIFNPTGSAAAAYVTQKEHYALPIRTYSEIEADTFSAIIGSLTKINELGEGAGLQIIATTAPWAKKKIAEHVKALKKGASLKSVLGGGQSVDLSTVGDILNPKSKSEKAEEKAERVTDNDAITALEAKMKKPLFSVNVRLVASASTPFQANDILEGLAAGFSQFAAPQRNELRIVKPRNPNKLVYDFSFRRFNSSQAMVLNTEEIASFYHLPISATETPKVKYLKAKEAPPPSNLSSEGTLIGQSSFRGQLKPVYITDEDRKRHVYMVGQTGTGKSTLLGNMIISDIRRGKGVAIIDPHGELVETALMHIPEERKKDVIFFDPADLWRPLGLNMLDYNFDRPEEKTFIVNEMQSIFNKLFPPESMGPMFEQYMRNALLLLMEDMQNEPATLIEVPRVFTDAQFRLRKLSRIHNPVLVDFWQKEAAKAGGEASLANMTPYITSKFNNFIANDFMRPIIGQPKSAFNFREVMDEGKILLINLSKGRIGDINAGLLGMIFTGKILMAALSRADVPDKSKRRDFNLYIDEFQNFTTDSIATILSEARKYGLSLTMAHQFIAQLTDKIKDAVFGNVGSQIVMRIGIQDAEFLVKQFEPVFDENDLVNIDNFNAFVKLLIHGETSKPFNINIGRESHAKGNAQAIHELKEYSRSTYGADREEIEDDIYKRLRV